MGSDRSERSRREGIEHYTRSLSGVPGWLDAIDFTMLQMIDEVQGRIGITGDILEIGAYQGRTAILLQYFCRQTERLAVCDVFEHGTGHPDSERERAEFYMDLTRLTFERHFLAYHSVLPDIYQCRSQELQPRLAGRRFRLVHIDGSHVHAMVRSDLRTAQHIVVKGGVVAIDDYRREHTPGVAAAAWEQVATEGLAPICLTPGKLYGCWRDAELYAEGLRRLANADAGLRTDEELIGGRVVLRVSDASVEGPSREEFLAAKLEQLKQLSQVEFQTVRRELEATRGKLERERQALKQQEHIAGTWHRRAVRMRAALQDHALELAKQELRNNDLQLRLSLLEAALGIPGLER
jgi:hypothetical protein